MFITISLVHSVSFLPCILKHWSLRAKDVKNIINPLKWEITWTAKVLRLKKLT
jgi:hypothetical protein